MRGSTYLTLAVCSTLASACADAGFAGADFCEDCETDGSTDEPTGHPPDLPEDTDDEVDPPAVECTPDCGEFGTCVDVDGEGMCECDDGYVMEAAGCVTCAAVQSPLEIDVPVVTVTARVFVDGMPAPASEYDDALIYLENPRHGDRVLLGNTHDEELSVRVAPGLYDVVYEAQTPGDAMPINTHHVLETVQIETDGALDVELSVGAAVGNITIDGEPPPESEYQDGWIWLRHGASGEEFAVGNTHDGAYSALVIAGTYEVRYRYENGEIEVPANEDALLGELEVQGKEQLSDLDIEAPLLSGEIRIDGELAPNSEYEDGNLYLRNEAGDQVWLGNTHDGSYERRVVAGEYALYYDHETGGAEVPSNRRAKLADIEVSQSAVIDLDVPVVDLSGAITINGGPPPASEYDDGILYLRDPMTGDEVRLGNTHDQAYSVRLVPGVYDLVYGQETAGAELPRNTSAVLGQLNVDASMGLPLDIPAVSVTGGLTVDGGPPPDDLYASGRLYLRDEARGDSVLLGETHEGGYAAMVVPGDYGLFYVEETAGPGVPGNQDARLGDVSVVGAMSFDVDVPAVALSGNFTVGGLTPPDSPGDSGSVYLRAGADSALLGSTHDGGWSAALVSGSYGIYYRVEKSVEGVPENIDARIGCVTIE